MARAKAEINSYVRLFLRKTDAWFRIEKLSYPKDISDIEAACKILQSEEVGFADRDDQISLEEAANLLSMEELKTIAKDAKIPGGNKPALISGLKKAATAQTGLRVGGGQLQLSFNNKGNYVNRSDHFLKRILKKTGIITLLTFCFGNKPYI
jgi:Fanconi-associated nuclease 1